MVPLLNKHDYWLCFTRQPTVTDVISRNRIIYLLSVLHFHDNRVEKHKIENIEPILKYYNEFIVETENNLSIGKQMTA